MSNTMIKNVIVENNHKFTLNRNNAKTFNWQVQSFELPSISITSAKATSSPKIASHNIAGSALYFDQLKITFLLDEDLDSWIEIYKWLKEFTNGYKHQKDYILDLEATASLHVLTNNKAPTGKIFQFHRVWPVWLGPIQFGTDNSEPTELTCTVIFNIDHYDLELKTGEVI